jgi:hypothetical protein
MLTSAAALALVLMRGAPSPQHPAPAAPAAQKPDPQTKKPDKPKPIFKLGDEHPEIDLGKGSRLELRARFAVDRTDSEASTADPAETSTIDLGKRRVGVSGEIRNAIEFQVEAELDDDDPWRDVYAEFKSFAFGA